MFSAEARGQFYISHDSVRHSAENDLENYSRLFEKYPKAELAINVKELGYEAALVELVRSGKLGQKSFYFDFELLELQSPGAAQRKIKCLSNAASVRLASRLSDRNERIDQCLGIPGEIVWGDEFDSLWITEREVTAIKAANRILYMISPEIHGFDWETTLRRWHDFKTWGVDGLCTDYPLEARKFFG